MTYFETENPDPSWLSTIADRKAVLWISKSASDALAADAALGASLFARSWHSIYLDAKGLTDSVDAASTVPTLGSLKIRSIDGDPDDAGELASNRLPIYVLPEADPADDPRGFATRLKMFARLPRQATMFIVTEDPGADLASVRQATRTTPEGIREAVVVSARSPELALAADRLVHWKTSAEVLHRWLDQQAATRSKDGEAAVRIHTTTGVQTVDFSGAIDPSYPITERFFLLPARKVLAEVRGDETLVRSLLESSSFSIEPYAAGVVFHRTYDAEKDARKALRRFEDRGHDATSTAWIDAEQASGATTALRDLAYKLAREGFPVLLARPEIMSFDFQQISAFLRSASRIASEQTTGRLGEYPWVLLFDAEHTTRSSEFLSGLASGLRKREQAALVVAVRPVLSSAGAGRYSAAGPSCVLGNRFRNVVARGEAEQFGQHLNRFLPSHRQRRPEEWVRFCQESEHLTGDGKQSLFWLAVRFWLFRMPDAEQPLRRWLLQQIEASISNSPARTFAALVVAVLSRHRLTCPLRLLTEEEEAELAPLLKDKAQPLGLQELWGALRGSVAFPHPLIAEELLRVCASSPDMLQEAGVSQCAGVFDLELSVLEQVIPRKRIGLPEVIPVLEELVTTALRVDPRAAPQNYQSRERIVMMLERAPDSVFDQSQVFLHHLAISRRHLAADPPAAEFWQADAAVREQLELAEEHLNSAIHDVKIKDEERRETPLNLHVSLALTYSVRAELEWRTGNTEKSDQFIDQAHQQYQQAQALDPDNTYVLENFARLKLRQARETTDESARLNLIVDAMALLEWELAIDEQNKRETVALEEFAKAIGLLGDASKLTRIQAAAMEGREAASIVLARLLADPERFGSLLVAEPDLESAIAALNRIKPEEVTWRSRLLLYDLTSTYSPLDFAARFDPLEELRALGEFPWPLQVLYEHAILLYQLGHHQRGRDAFASLRDTFSSRGSAVRIPPELERLADPRDDYRSPLRTALRVTRTTDTGRNYWGIPEGWGSIDVPFRPWRFPRKIIRNGDDLDCLIQFTSFGPQAVPPTEA